MTAVRFLCLLAPFVAASDSFGQDTIDADRPGITLSPVLMPEGRFQIEAGTPNLVLTRGDGAHSDFWSTPILLRYGMTSDFELRLAGSPWNRFHDDTSGTDAEGFGDIEIGTKVALTQENGSVPTSAVIATVHLPTGDDDFTTHQAGYSLNFAADWTVGDKDILRGLAGITRTPVGDENALVGSLGVLMWHPFTDRFSGYVELGWFPNIDNSVTTAVAGLGVGWLLNNDLQLDAFGDFGLNQDTPDAAVGVGVSWRF